MDGPEISDVTTPPPPRTEVDETLAPGESETVELERSGASVRLTRIITESGEETREVFRSEYKPTGLVTAIGPTPGGPAQPGATGTPSSEPSPTTQAGPAP